MARESSWAPLDDDEYEYEKYRDEKKLKKKLRKLASDVPSLRPYLLPILRSHGHQRTR